MKISTKIRYGTRAMLELAFHYGEGPVELKEIAKKENISIKYLEQVTKQRGVSVSHWIHCCIWWAHYADIGEYRTFGEYLADKNV